MFELTARLDCGGFHTTRARMRGGTPLGALDIYIAPPPLEAWGAVIAACGHQGKSEGSGSPNVGTQGGIEAPPPSGHRPRERPHQAGTKL